MQCCASHFDDDDPDEGAAALIADGSGATEHEPTLDSGYHAVCDPCGWTGDPHDTKEQPARDCQQHDVDEHGGTVTSEIRRVAYESEAPEVGPT